MTTIATERMSQSLLAIRGAFVEQLQELFAVREVFFALLNAIPTVMVVAWLASRSGDSSVLSYLYIGALLWAIWTLGAFNVGWSLSNEFGQGTLAMTLIAPAPLLAVLYGKALGQMAFLGGFSGIGGLLAIVAITQQAPDFANTPAMVGSVLVAVFAIAALGIVLTPAMVLTRGRGGFFNAILPFVVVFSGFLYPVRVLPPAMEAAARIFPTSWASRAIERSVNDGWAVATLGEWAISIALSVAFLVLTQFLLVIVERRIRVTGELAV